MSNDMFMALWLLAALAGCGRGGDSEQAGGRDRSPNPLRATDPRGAAARPSPSMVNAAAAAVTLGAPRLTAGIPGEGDLTIEQIREWLDQPAHHEPLEVSLPLGLSGALPQLDIPDDNPLTLAKIELGRQLFFDQRLSADHTVSCASCHHPDEGYARHTQYGEGIGRQVGRRNAPAILNRVLSGAQAWGGAADSLETQVLAPITALHQMGSTHEEVVRTLSGIDGYTLQFQRIFGGEEVAIENVAAALAAFVRTLVTGPSPFDYYEPLHAMERDHADELKDLEAFREDEPELYQNYLALRAASEQRPISEAARRGRDLFFGDRAGCSRCHSGANFSDEQYHRLGVGADRESPDLGRFEVTQKDADRGAFRTPSLRNVALTAPYMHDGSLKTLNDAVDWHFDAGPSALQASPSLPQDDFSPEQRQDLVEFLKACTGALPQVEQGRLPP